LGFTSAAVGLCYEPIQVDGGGLESQATSAFAKEGNNGNGRGGGNGKGFEQCWWIWHGFVV
jgi:hypothetical protein